MSSEPTNSSAETGSGTRKSTLRALVVIGAAALVVLPVTVWAADTFTDVPDANVHHDSINAIADAGVTQGCTSTAYCPGDFVRRDQMGTFLDRLGALSPGQDPVVNAATVQGLGPDDLQGETGPQGPAGPEGPEGPAGEPATRLFAVVQSDGTLDRGAGTTSTSRVTSGEPLFIHLGYEVVFDQDVTDCAYNATIGHPGTTAAGPGFIAVSSRSEEPNGVFVRTHDEDGTLAQRPFHLAVFC